MRREGEMQAQIEVLQLPPKLSVNNLVNLLSLNGTCYNEFSFAKANIQLLSAAIDLFIFFASYKRIPSEFVFFHLPLPAKSTIVSKAFL